MHIVVMNKDDFVATHPKTVIQYTVKCPTITKIYRVRKIITLIYVHYVISCFGLCVLLIFFDFVFYFIRILNFLLYLETTISLRLSSQAEIFVSRNNRILRYN